ncbi:MAG TPA: MBL fold metallo-hydrolase [Acidimicrobiales bacterium]
MSELTQRWRVGEATITAVVESQTDGIPPAFFFPTADEALVTAHRWVLPHYADDAGRLSMRVQAFVVEVADRLVVVDPCIGNHKRRSQPFWDDQEWPFMERFRAAGFDPEAVDTVVHTHLHVDHVGWDTHLDDGRWVPTFTRARHLYVDTELDWSATNTESDAPQIREDSIVPVLEAGLADVAEADADLGDGLRLAPTQGHTPGHASLWISSAGRLGLVTGDAIHHPVQCAEPDVSFVSDDDPERARASRRSLLGQAADAEALVLGTHFATEPAGRVAVAGETWRFRPEPGAVAG